MELGQLLEELMTKSWTASPQMTADVQDLALKQGKRAVVASKGGTFRKYCCASKSPYSWFINASLMRHKQKEAAWYATACSLEHVNCTGVSKSTQRQVAATAVMRSFVAADNAASVPSLSDHLKLQAGLQCHPSVVNRAKQQLLAEMFSEDSKSIQLLPRYLSELTRANSSLYTELQRDPDGRFDKAIIVLDSQLFSNGQQIFGVDAAHMKHRSYNGVQLVLVARDGNMENKVAAVALAPVESAPNYKWFFGILLARGFPLSHTPVFSDRHTGIVSAAASLNVRVFFCTRHIIGNMRADAEIKLQVSQESFVWAAQASKTRAVYCQFHDLLEDTNSSAGRYLKGLDPEQWVLYPHYNTTRLYGWRTTNFVESEQARSLKLKPRKMLPYKFFRAFSKIIMSECYKRVSQAEQWKQCRRTVTPRADSKLQLELKHAFNYSVAFSTPNLYYVSHQTSKLESNLEVCLAPPSCPCSLWTQFGLPCRHIVVTLGATGSTDRSMSMFSPCYTTATYAEHLSSIRLPSEHLLYRDEGLLPVPRVPQAGRPRKRRFRSRGEKRVRAVYQRRQCGKKDGHNKATCRHK